MMTKCVLDENKRSFVCFFLCLIFSKEVPPSDVDVEQLDPENSADGNQNTHNNQNVQNDQNDQKDQNNKIEAQDFVPFQQIPYEQRNSFVLCAAKHKLKHKILKSTRSSGNRGCDQCDKTISSNDPHHYCYEKNEDGENCNLDLCVGCYFKNTNLTKRDYLQQIKTTFRSIFEIAVNTTTVSIQSTASNVEFMENGIYKDIKENEEKIFNYDANAPTLRPGDEITVTICETGMLPVCDLEFRIKEIVDNECIYRKQSNDDTHDIIIGQWLDSSNNSFKISFNNCLVTNLHHETLRRTTWNLKDLRLIPGKVEGNGSNIVEEETDQEPCNREKDSVNDNKNDGNNKSHNNDDDEEDENLTDNDDVDIDIDDETSVEKPKEKEDALSQVMTVESTQSDSTKRVAISRKRAADRLDDNYDDPAKVLNPSKRRKLSLDSKQKRSKETDSNWSTKETFCWNLDCPKRGQTVSMVFTCDKCKALPVSCPYCYRSNDITKSMCQFCRKISQKK